MTAQPLHHDPADGATATGPAQPDATVQPASVEPLLVLLHGHGDIPERFGPFAEQLAAATGWAVRCPAAPHALAGGGLAWWTDEDDGPSPATLEGLARTVAAAAGAAPAAIWLIGFSQGGAMALCTAHYLATKAAGTVPAAAGVVAGVVVVSGFLPGAAVSLPAGTPVLVVHGRADDVVDPFHGELVVRRLRRQDCVVSEAHHDGGHEWDDTVTALVTGWLLR